MHRGVSDLTVSKPTKKLSFKQKSKLDIVAENENENNTPNMDEKKLDISDILRNVSTVFGLAPVEEALPTAHPNPHLIITNPHSTEVDDFLPKKEEINYNEIYKV
jgi:hypothetical protein